MTEVELLAITLARGRPPAKKDGLARKKKIKNKGHEKDLLQKNYWRILPEKIRDMKKNLLQKILLENFSRKNKGEGKGKK